MKKDVVIIGGSYAGLSAAMALGRAIRTVVVIDSGKPCNSQTPHSHNFLTRDGSEPAEIAALGKAQVMKYPTVRFVNGNATTVTGEDLNFQVSLEDGQVFFSKKVLFATGLKDLMPDITGFSACWGISVIHCPYCHGYEYKGQNTGVLMNGAGAFELARMIKNWTDGLSVFTNGPATLEIDQLQKLSEMNVQVEEREIERFDHQNGILKNIVFKDGLSTQVDALYARPPFEQHCSIPNDLGCKMTGTGHIEVDELQKSSIPGIYVAGDIATMMRSVASAVYTGNKAGAMIVHELVAQGQ
ncbi:NAD(P)/FAD-dependent oxidoreductase [Pedobacter frigoris]|uniref:NAD(P)/FAD-dependent oxidoreductase n=1 Tax=Pedobacter frigoris TaxID=2571272 RepID=A0A4U1CFG9_9SPHI|nr:NAD(P)/FAD-dependent oxidoreductase [Pedobacter frigoris]TKC05087.1 NAD(P)/FAD-dependent oxidoreductase [Pedobacter frigoris]